MNNLLKKIDESIEFNSKESPHLPEINIGLYIAREIIQGEQKRKRPIKASKGEEEYNGCPICKNFVYDNYCGNCGLRIDWRAEE